MFNGIGGVGCGSDGKILPSSRKSRFSRVVSGSVVVSVDIAMVMMDRNVRIY